MQYWFYAGAAEEKGDRDKDSIIDVIDDTKDIINLLEKKNVVAPEEWFTENYLMEFMIIVVGGIVFPEFFWAFRRIRLTRLSIDTSIDTSHTPTLPYLF